MKAQKTIALSVICICLFFSISRSSTSSEDQSLSSLPWGATVEGLQMLISTADSRKTDAPELQIIFRNVGEKDITLNLGMMLANGKVQLPNRIGFDLTDASGKTRKFNFFDGR